MSAPDLETINHFCQLAARGAHPAASTGERVANRLAKALHAIGDDMALLDSEAIQGFSLLCQAASGPWSTDDAKFAVFTVIRKAAAE